MKIPIPALIVSLLVFSSLAHASHSFMIFNPATRPILIQGAPVFIRPVFYSSYMNMPIILSPMQPMAFQRTVAFPRTMIITTRGMWR